MSKLSWKTLTSEYLVNAPWAVLRKDSCVMPNGYLVPEYYVLEYPNWVNVVAITAENDIILIKQYRHGIKEDVLEIPGGVIDKGETSLEAAKRELLEETGYTFDSFEKISELYPNPATSNNKTTTYIARGGTKTGEQQLDNQEEIEVYLTSCEEVKQLLLENRFGQALHSAALFYALFRIGLFR